MGSGEGPRLLGGADPILARIWHAPWPPFCAKMTPREAKVIPNGTKWRQKEVKILQEIFVKITIHFHTPFYTKSERKGSQKMSKIYENSMHKLMSDRTGGEKCDMQSDRENTYDSSLFSNIEVIKNNENH